MKKFKKSEWQNMPIAKLPSPTMAMIRRDSDGIQYLWVRANGRNVWANAIGSTHGIYKSQIWKGSE